MHHLLKSLVSSKITEGAQWEYLLKPNRNNHSAPEYKSILCWQLSGSAPLILFPYIRSGSLFFGSIQDYLRQQGYNWLSSISSFVPEESRSFLLTLNYNTFFSVADCSCQHARTLLQDGVEDTDLPWWFLHSTQLWPGSFPLNGFPCFAKIKLMGEQYDCGRTHYPNVSDYLS